MLNWKCKLLPVMVATMTVLVGCHKDGGGGGGGGGLVEADKDFPAAVASQGFANSAVDELNGLAEEIHEAYQSAGLPYGARIAAPPTGATSDVTIQCSQIFTGGTGSIDVSATVTSGGDPVSTELDYNDCNYAVAGVTTTLDGTVDIEFSDYVDVSHYTVTYTFDLTIAIASVLINESFTISTSETCTYDGESVECHYAVGDGYTLDDYEVSIEGTVLTINAVITTANGTIEFNNWAFDLATGQATSGSILITYENGDSVETTATETGYDVDVTINGTTTSYTVPFAT